LKAVAGDQDYHDYHRQAGREEVTAEINGACQGIKGCHLTLNMPVAIRLEGGYALTSTAARWTAIHLSQNVSDLRWLTDFAPRCERILFGTETRATVKIGMCSIKTPTMNPSRLRAAERRALMDKYLLRIRRRRQMPLEPSRLSVAKFGGVESRRLGHHAGRRAGRPASVRVRVVNSWFCNRFPRVYRLGARQVLLP
jgi:hypothetical protein